MSGLPSVLSSSFASGFLIVLRESFEAFLLVGILLGLLAKLGVPQHRKRVLLGTAAGVAAAVAVGTALLVLAGNLRETSEAAFEAAASLLAVTVLTYMVVWMYRHTQQAMGGLSHKVRAALEAGTLGSLFLIPFLAVVREGFETVLFLAADPDAPTGPAMALAVALGLAVAVLLGALLFKGVVRLSVERFFALTGALLVLFGGWILAMGMHELGELLEGSPSLHQAGEAIADVGAWAAGALYVLAMLAWYLRPVLRRRAAKAQA
jgi:high-affinity iron transporter